MMITKKKPEGKSLYNPRNIILIAGYPANLSFHPSWASPLCVPILYTYNIVYYPKVGN